MTYLFCLAGGDVSAPGAEAVAGDDPFSLDEALESLDAARVRVKQELDKAGHHTRQVPTVTLCQYKTRVWVNKIIS